MENKKSWINQSVELNKLVKEDEVLQENIMSHNPSQYFKIMEKIVCQDVVTLKNALKQNGIKVHQNFSNSFQKIILRMSGNSYSLQISQGFFETEISLLMVNVDSSQVLDKYFFQGSYGEIFIQQFENTTYAVKSQKISEQNLRNFGDEFDEILKQYLALKISSILEFGPSLQKLFEFDIICFKNSVVFSMEFCIVPPIHKTAAWKKLQFDLLCSLKTMHSLQMVHRDIKSSNICWSQKFQKWVFLDFGFVSFVKQTPGVRTYTSFRGTYSHTCQQMRDLFHLKKNGFVDLYKNDIYGFNIAKVKFLKQYGQIVQVQKQVSSLFFQKILIIRMQYYIFYENFTRIEMLFLKYTERKNEFLGLLLMGIQNKKTSKEQGQQEFFIQYKKLKQIPFTCQVNADEKIINFFKHSIKKQEQNQKYQLFFLNESDLVKLIQKEWGKISFMKYLFTFFDEIICSNSEVSWIKMKLITDILVNYLVKNQNLKKKMWSQKFHLILIEFQYHFFQKKQFNLLISILFYYFLLNDRGRERQLSNKLVEHGIDESQKINGLLLSLHNSLFHFFEKDQIRSTILELKKKNISENQNQQNYSLLEGMFSLVSEMMQKNQITEEKLNQLQKFSIMLSENLNFSTLVLNLILKRIRYLKNDCCFMFQNRNQIVLKKQFVKVSSTEKHLSLLQILNNLEVSSLNSMQSYFESYPVFHELPQLYNFQYNVKKGHYEKASKIAQCIFDFNRQNLLEVNKQLNFMISRWKNQKNMKDQLNFIFSAFNSFLKKISLNSIHKIWKFYTKFFLLFEIPMLGEENTQYSSIISSLQFIINFFQFEKNSPTKRIYIEFFIFLKSLLKGSFCNVDQWLQELKKKSLINQVIGNSFLLADFLEFMMLCEIKTECVHFKETYFFKELLSNNIIENWHFSQVPAFFIAVLSFKVKEQKIMEAIYAFKSFTQYLTLHKIQMIRVSLHFSQFIGCTLKNHLQNILINFLQTEKLGTVRKNNYLSAFIFMLYLACESMLRKQLKLNQIKRIYFLSILRINYFPDSLRIQLSNLLKYKFRKVLQIIKPRKKGIVNRQEDYAKNIVTFLKKECQKKFDAKIEKYLRIRKYFFKKIYVLQQNLQLMIPETDQKFQKIF